MPALTIADDLSVLRDGERVGRLTRGRAAALLAIHAAQGRPVSEADLYKTIVPGGSADDPEESARLHVYMVRSVIGKSVIERIRGRGAWRLGPGWRIEVQSGALLVVRIPDDMLPALQRAADAHDLLPEEMAIKAIREFLG